MTVTFHIMKKKSAEGNSFRFNYSSIFITLNEQPLPLKFYQCSVFCVIRLPHYSRNSCPQSGAISMNFISHPHGIAVTFTPIAA